jgi:meso-butanediol dehydrogenase/(S,S)-butanediol dehydrogenase/diacetyl reductase
MHALMDKRVLITGGTSGIGKATAARFLEEGAEVIILARDRDKSEHARHELAALRQVVIADVSNPAEVRRAFDEIDRLWQSVDVLVNSAGISIRHAFMDIIPEEWERVLNINLNGVFYMAQQAARRMLAAGSGAIINIASTNGLMGYPFYADYNASKAGVIELTRTMALELAPAIRVIAVCPGYVMTPMQEAEYTQEMLNQINDKIPLRRHAQPEEVAALIAFLASEEASFITAHTYVIDGGEIAGGLASQQE